MGMFDTVRCALPQVTPPDVEWQTKNLDCLLDLYTIDAHGQLWRECLDPDSVDGYGPPIQVCVTGSMTFGTEVRREWWAYRATLERGLVVAIARVAPADKAFDDLFL
jgi:hypothetical protein